MKFIDITESNEIKTVTTSLESVMTKNVVAKGKAMKMVFVNTSEGNFSNLWPVWVKQGLDIEDLTEGDKLKISYIEKFYKKTGSYFNNFTRIEVVKKAVRAEDVMNHKRAEEIKAQQLVDEVVD